jgi:deazaflavin-dependent oxidoreductase (nitroreductase family)
MNLQAAGAAEIQVGGKRIRVRTEAVGFGSPQYDDIWRRAVAVYPDYDTYKTRTTRQIPVVELVPG